jgi:hypothetical protein
MDIVSLIRITLALFGRGMRLTDTNFLLHLGLANWKKHGR